MGGPASEEKGESSEAERWFNCGSGQRDRKVRVPE